MAKSNAGGGANSRQVRPGQKLGATATGIRPSYPDTLGNMRGSHVTDRGDLPYNPIPMQTVKPPISVPLGNAVATNVGAGGPGKGREIHRTGTQMQYGAATSSRPAPTGADPLAAWFPNSPGRQSPVKK